MFSQVIGLLILVSLNLCASNVVVVTPVDTGIITHPNKHPNSETTVPIATEPQTSDEITLCPLDTQNSNIIQISKGKVKKNNNSLDKTLFESVTAAWAMAQSIWPQPVGSHYVFWNTKSGSILCIVPSDIFSIVAHLLYKSRENIGRIVSDVTTNYNKPISIKTLLVARSFIQSINNIITDQQQFTNEKTVVINLNSLLVMNSFSNEEKSSFSFQSMISDSLLSEAGNLLSYLPLSDRHDINDVAISKAFNLTISERKNLILFGSPNELISVTRIAVKKLMYRFNLSNEALAKVIQKSFSINGISSMSLTELGITSLQQINNELFPDDSVDQILDMALQ